MTNLNNVVLEGRLVRDASEGYKTSKSGEYKTEASFIDCKGFGSRYNYAVPKMTKGKSGFTRMCL